MQIVYELPSSTPFGINSEKPVEDSTVGIDLRRRLLRPRFAAFCASVFPEESLRSIEILITPDAKRDRCERLLSPNLTIDLMPLRKAFQSVEPHDDTLPIDTSEASITLTAGEQNVVNLRYSLDQYPAENPGKSKVSRWAPKPVISQK